MSSDEEIGQKQSIGNEDSGLYSESSLSKDISDKKAYYDSQIQKLQEGIESLDHTEPDDTNLIWAKTREFISICNKAGEHLMRAKLFDQAKEKFIKAKAFLERSVTSNFQQTVEWKTLKIAAYKNISNYYNKTNKPEKSLNFLKRVLPIQKELQKSNIILPGVEFFYISMADLAYKLSLYEEAYSYCQSAIQLIEKQLSIQKGVIPSSQPPHWASFKEDPKIQMVRSRKFIALSYISYHSGKVLQAMNQHANALPHYEKAVAISRQYLGPGDKITVSYIKKLESCEEKLSTSKAPPPTVRKKSQPKVEDMQKDTTDLKPRANVNRDELNSILQEYNIEKNNQSIVSKRQSTDVQQQNKSMQDNVQQPKLHSTHKSINTLHSRLNSISNGLFSPIQTPHNAKNIKHVFLSPSSSNYSYLKGPNDPQSTKNNTIAATSPQNESALENNDLLIFDFSNPNISMNRARTREQMSAMGITPPSRINSRVESFSINENGNSISKTNLESSNKTSKKKYTLTINPPTPDSLIQIPHFSQSAVQSPLVADFSSTHNTSQLKEGTKSASLFFTPSQMKNGNQGTHSKPKHLKHRETRRQSSSMMLYVASGSLVLNNLTTSFNKQSPNQILHGDQTISIPLPRPQTGNKDSQQTVLASQAQLESPEKAKLRPKSAAFFKNDSKRNYSLSLKLPLEKATANRSLSPILVAPLRDNENMGSSAQGGVGKAKRQRQLSQTESENVLKLKENQIKNRLDVSSSDSGELEEVFSNDCSQLRVKKGFKEHHEFKIATSSSSYDIKKVRSRKKNISQGLVAYLKESTKKDLQVYQEQDIRGRLSSSPRRPVLDGQESNRIVDPVWENRESLGTPGFDRADNQFFPHHASYRFNNRDSMLLRQVSTVEIRSPAIISNSKAVKDLKEFRKIEEEACTTIQRYFRLRRARKENLSLNAIHEKNDDSGHIEPATSKKLAIEPTTTNRTLGLMSGAFSDYPPTGLQDRGNVQLTIPGPNYDENRSPAGAYPSPILEWPIDYRRSESLGLEKRAVKLFDIDIESDTHSMPSPKGENKIVKSYQDIPTVVPEDLVIVSSYTGSVKNMVIQNSSKKDVIKSALENLNTYDIEYHQNLQGFASFWKLSYIGLEDAPNNQYRIKVKLRNEKMEYLISRLVSFKDAELSVFSFSIWPLVLQAISHDQEFLEVLNQPDAIQIRREIETVVLISGFKDYRKKCKKMSSDEEARIRRLLFGVSIFIKQKTISYRQKTGYRLVDQRDFKNGKAVSANRQALWTQKAKYFKVLNSLATQISFFSFTHERNSQMEWQLPSAVQTLETQGTRLTGSRILSSNDVEGESLHSFRLNSQVSLPSYRSVGHILTGASPRVQAQLSLTHKKALEPLIEIDEVKASSKELKTSTKEPKTSTKEPASSSKEPFGRSKTLKTAKEEQAPSKTSSKTVIAPRRPRRMLTSHTELAAVQKPKFVKQESANLLYSTEKPHKLVKKSSIADILNMKKQEVKETFPSFISETDRMQNPFLKREVILQTIMKHENEFLFVSVRVDYSNDASQTVDIENDSFEFICEAEKPGIKWFAEVSVQPKFLSKTLFNKFITFSIKDFLINEGLSSLQKKLLTQYLAKNLLVQNSQLAIAKEVPNRFEKNPIEHMESLCDFHSFLKLRSLNKNWIFDSYDMYSRTQSRRKRPISVFRSSSPSPTKPTLMALTQSSRTFDVRVLSPNDPVYDTVSAGEELFAKSAGVEWLSFYNEVRCTFENKYYFTIRQKNNIFFIRLRFVRDTNGTESIFVTRYHAVSHLLDYIVIKDKQIIERIITIIQLKDNKLRDDLMLNLLGLYRTLVGNKMVVNEMALKGRFNEKLDLLPTNILHVLICNREERLPTYGMTSQKLFRKGYIRFLGDCYITVTISKLKGLNESSKIVCFKFEVQPFASKTKLYKFLLNSNDLSYYFDSVVSVSDDVHQNLNVISAIISQLWLTREHLYSSLQIPISNKPFLPNPSQLYVLDNEFDNNIRASEANSNVSNYGQFLKPKLCENRLVLQRMRKIGGVYYIFTVKKHLILNYWAITIYNPHTCRKFIATLYLSDIVTMQLSFLEKVCPSNLKEIDGMDIQDYSKFCEVYQQLQKDKSEKNVNVSSSIVYFSRETLQDHSFMQEDDTRSFLNGIAAGFLLEEKQKRNTGTIPSRVLREETRLNYIEIKFWENVISELSVEYTTSGISILRISEFRGVIREHLCRDIIRMSKSEEALVEIFIENPKAKFELQQVFKPIPDIYTPNYIFFMRVTSIHKMHTYNNKFSLQQAINLYHSDKDLIKVPIYDQKQKVNLSKVGLISSFMVHKIKQMNIIQVSDDEMKSRKRSLDQKIIYPWDNSGLKLNCNFQIQMKIDDQHLFVDKFLIYRTVLSLQPSQLVALVYFEVKKYFMAYIYDDELSWIIKKKIRIQEVETFVPYAKNMLKLGLYTELGSKILKAFKNSLIIHSYINNRSGMHFIPKKEST